MFKVMPVIFIYSLSSAIFSDTIYTDGFESATLATSNTTQFNWEGPNRTSVVRGSTTTVVYDGNPVNIAVTDGRDWRALEGDYSLRFRYPAGQAMTEQRFQLGGQYPEVWLNYWIRIPVNYSHGDGGGGATNNKFMSLWSDGYEAAGTGSSYWLSLHDAGNGSSSLGFTYSEGDNTGSLAYAQDTAFIQVPQDRGLWKNIVLHVRMESSPGASDGLIEAYISAPDSERYSRIHHGKNLKLKLSELGAGLQSGYFMGWANGSYSQDTEWLIDQVEFSTTSLLNPEYSIHTENSPKMSNVTLVLPD